MTQSERWRLALAAHAAEHAAMRERGLGRLHVVGRPGIGALTVNVSRPRARAPLALRSPASRGVHAFMRRRGLRGLDGVTDPSQIVSVAQLAGYVLVGAALGAAGYWTYQRYA